MPFTSDEFDAIFAAWNAAAWPFALLAYHAGLLIFVLCLNGKDRSMKIVLLLLGIMWIVCGIGYFGGHFIRGISWTSAIFSPSYALQGVFLILFALTTELRAEIRRDLLSVLALGIMAYGLFLYPLLGWWSEEGALSLQLLGVSPNPTTMFTLGILMILRGTGAGTLFVSPVLWGVIGGSTGALLTIPPDYGLLAATAAVILLWRCDLEADSVFSEGAGIKAR
ncbi:hypothetical protein KUV62_06730 [Salipiger bermudensis]|uniref:DUF6064 family protein n=1 Tax=Salipiger bermudensis TaxID=344736 RepID=UPI001C993F36|nr:DUF6064 family protein [Salipiger bermudensis]MBY6003594.1 hypothetical protein [Salipiger bermudensis]